jgi:hypothetical protein
LNNYIGKIETNINAMLSHEMRNNSSFRNRLLFSNNWLEKSDSILEHLFISDSIYEFCSYSNLDTLKASEIINQIKSKCDELLTENKILGTASSDIPKGF